MQINNKLKYLFICLVLISSIGCSKPIPNVSVVKLQIPDNFLDIPEVDTNRSLNSSLDMSLFILDIYEGYKKCVINLKV